MIDKVNLIKDMKNNMTVKEIAKKYNCSEMTIYRAMNKYNIKRDEPLYKNKKLLQNKLNNKSIDEISEELKVDISTIKRWIKKFDLELNKEKPLYQNKEWLIEKANQFNTIKEIADKYNLNEYTLSCWYRKFNIKLNHSKNTDFNENYFNKINCENKAYFLGFLMADGCMNKDLNTISLGLKLEDEYMLKKLLSELNYKKKITYAKSGFNKDAAYIQIHSIKMCKDLIYLGISPKKSGKEYFPKDEIEYKFIKDFIRGFLDGDGWITNYINEDKYYNVQTGFVSMSINILIGIKEFIKKEINIEGNINKRKDRDNLYDLIFYSNNAKQFLDYIYKDSNIFLIRKKEKYDNVKLGPIYKK